MSFSMFGASVLTIASAASPSFFFLISLNFLKGMTITGLSAVALAYLSEEVSVESLGFVISLYLSGNILGGMLGRVVAGLFSSWLGWRAATLFIGLLGFALAVAFQRVLPKSQNFERQNIKPAQKLRQMKQFLFRPGLLSLFVLGALLMCIFVSSYNYLNYRLEAPPFSLPHYLIAFVYVMYIAGIAGSMLAGRWSDSYSPVDILRVLLIVLIVGLFFLLSGFIWTLTFGLGLLTFGFFGAHTMASRMVSLSVEAGTSTAVSLYWLFYYTGSSVIGTASGALLPAWGWTVFIYTLIGLGGVSLIISFFSHDSGGSN